MAHDVIISNKPFLQLLSARYFILHHYGGIYADMDYEPTTNFYDELPQNTVAAVER
jgi:mannosyltransferase OCH1-like enzyme